MSSCPICFEAAKDAVSIPCGHIFCSECLHEAIHTSMDEEEEEEDVFEVPCPTCRQTFPIVTPIPGYIPIKYLKFVTPAIRRVYLDTTELDALQRQVRELQAVPKPQPVELAGMQSRFDTVLDQLRAEQRAKQRLITQQEDAQTRWNQERQHLQAELRSAQVSRSSLHNAFAHEQYKSMNLAAQLRAAQSEIRRVCAQRDALSRAHDVTITSEWVSPSSGLPPAQSRHPGIPFCGGVMPSSSPHCLSSSSGLPPAPAMTSSCGSGMLPPIAAFTAKSGGPLDNADFSFAMPVTNSHQTATNFSNI